LKSFQFEEEVVLRKRLRRTTDDRRRTGGDHYSSLEPSAQLGELKKNVLKTADFWNNSITLNVTHTII